MSYTMMMDLPQKEAMYAMRFPQLQEEMKAIFIALVRTRMQADDSATADALETPGAALLASFKEADEMEAGIRPRQDFKDVDELMADCLA